MAMTSVMVLVGYPLFLVGQRMLSWTMPFMDSPAPMIALFLCWGVWLDAVLASGEKLLARALSPTLLIVLLGLSFWLKDSAYGMLIFLPAIAFIGCVMVPAAKAIHVVEQRKASKTMIIVDTLLVGCFFPFGVWILQPRLNAAMIENGTADIGPRL